MKRATSSTMVNNAASSSAASTSTTWRTSGTMLVLGFSLLTTITLLATSDAPPIHNLFVVTGFGWCLLAVGYVGHSLLKRQWIWTRADTAAGIWLAMAALSTAWVAGQGDLRSALNGMLTHTTGVMAFCLAPRLLPDERSRRSFTMVLVALIVALALLGLYQTTFIYPGLRTAIREHPEQVLREAGITGAVDSPEARLFLNRAESREPLATYTLTNTLAGVLLLGLVPLVLSLGKRPSSRGELVVRWGMVIALGGCLLLTKSRTAYLAFVVVMVASRAKLLRTLSWRWYLLGGLLIGLIIGGAILAGGIDAQVISEAPLSVRYRLEYWWAAGRMFADHWLLGVGPGNFQAVYTWYKLPSASENVADPHNFLFELLTTTGLAGTVAWLGWILFATRQFRMSSPPSTAVETIHSSPHPAIYMSSAVGLLITPLIMQLSQVGTDSIAGLPAIALLGLGMLLVGWFTQRQADEFISREAWRGGLLAVLINLGAAGGLSFPCLALPAYLLLALRDDPPPPQASRTTIPASQWAVMIMVVLVALFNYYACYLPALQAPQFSLTAHDAAEESRLYDAQTLAQRAADCDPIHPQYALQVADYAQAIYTLNPTPSAREAWQAAASEAIRRDPRSPRVREHLGDLLAQANTVEPSVTPAEFANAYQAAVERDPTNALLRAKWAWSLHLAGDTSAAHREAEEALRLDGLHQHTEKKLAQLYFTMFTVPSKTSVRELLEQRLSD